MTTGGRSITRLLEIGRAKHSQLHISVRQIGLRAVLRRVAFGYLQPQRFVVLRCALAELDETPVEGGGFEVAVWHRTRLQTWRGARTDLPVEFFQDQIHGVETCSVAHVDGNPVGLIWIYRPGDYSRFFHLGPGEAELNYGYVLPANRRRGLFQALLRAACLHLRDAGFRAVWAAVHAGNGPSLGAFRSAGFRDVSSVRHFLLYRPRVRRGVAA
jgi:ribosomal protein S18 acetylase RimI-like enzyme